MKLLARENIPYSVVSTLADGGYNILRNLAGTITRTEARAMQKCIDEESGNLSCISSTKEQINCLR